MIILCADDFGLSEGVSRGIVELCNARRLSATSAMVTFDDWSGQAIRLAGVRATTAVGLHLNLTLGRPLVAGTNSGCLDEDGTFLTVGQLIRRAAFRKARPGPFPSKFGRPLDSDAIRAECHAQIAAFRDAVGALPDFIDGHQHVHVLRGVRPALLAAIAGFTWPRPPLVRVPSSEGPWHRPARKNWGKNWTKRGIIAGLSAGMRDALSAAELPANDTFSGFSSFVIGSDYGEELRSALEGGGACHLVMCHPGHVDQGLAASGDPLVERRAEELAGIMAFEGLPERIWHPKRGAGGAIDWLEAIGA